MADQPGAGRAFEGRTERGNACTIVVDEDERHRLVLYLHAARETSLVLEPQVTEWLATRLGWSPLAGVSRE